MKFQAFTTAAVQDERLRTRMQASLAGNLRRGEGQKEFARAIDAEFDRAGLSRLKSHQIENIYVTNTSLSYGAGQMAQMLEVSDAFPFWKYSAVLDSRTRPDHARLHGKIFRVGDFTFWPPIGFRCRCTAIPLTARQAGRYPKADMPAAGEKRELLATLTNKEFAGDKQRNYMGWIAKRYEKADAPTRTLIDRAFETMKGEIRELEYQSAKEFFRDDYVKQIEKAFLKSRRVQRAATEAGLSKADAFRIYAYTDFRNGLSADLAKMHYTGDKPVRWKTGQLARFKKDFTKTLEKLPKYKGIVYRNLSGVDQDIARQWSRKGATIVWDGFSSTSISSTVHDGRSTRLVIRTKSARIVDALSRHPEEKEAVLLPGTRLKVMGVRGGTTFLNEI